MTNPTKYLVGGVDLSGIFQPLSGGTPAPALTHYEVQGIGDLITIFAPLSSGLPYPNATGFRVNNYNNLGQTLDLNAIFAKYNIAPFTTTGDTLITQPSPTSYLVYFKGSGTLTANQVLTINEYTLVGGGSSAGSGIYITNLYAAGTTAGGGGHVLNYTTSTGISNGSVLTITVGAGAPGNPSTSNLTPGQFGQDSSITGAITNSTNNSFLGGGGSIGSIISYNGGGGGGGGGSSVYLLDSTQTFGAAGGAGGSGGGAGSVPTVHVPDFIFNGGAGGIGQQGIDGIYYGGGGGGGASEGGVGGPASTGGGGRGAGYGGSGVSQPGTANTGGGGGGAYLAVAGFPFYPTNYEPRGGGSGIVIFRISI